MKAWVCRRWGHQWADGETAGTIVTFVCDRCGTAIHRGACGLPNGWTKFRLPGPFDKSNVSRCDKARIER